MIEAILISAALIFMCKNRNKSANIGRLFGRRASKKEIREMIERGDNINVNDGDLLANARTVYYYDDDNNIVTLNSTNKRELRRLINNTYLENQKTLRVGSNRDVLDFDLYENIWEEGLERKNYSSIFWHVVNYIRKGGKFAWDNKEFGDDIMLHGLGTYFNHSKTEQKILKNILDPNGEYVENMIEYITADGEADGDVEEAIIDAISLATSPKAAQELIDNEVKKRYEMNRYYTQYDDNLPF